MEQLKGKYKIKITDILKNPKSGRDAQILVETHSDHVLNGVRIALREGLIDPSMVTIYFFTNRSEQRVIKLAVDNSGGIKDWPEGFFDQIENDLSRL